MAIPKIDNYASYCIPITVDTSDSQMFVSERISVITLISNMSMGIVDIPSDHITLNIVKLYRTKLNAQHFGMQGDATEQN